MTTADKNVRVLIPHDVREQWEQLLAKKKISQQRAMAQLARFLLAQDDLVQSMILGQIDPVPDIVEIVLRRLQQRRGGGGRVVGHVIETESTQQHGRRASRVS